ncbi:bifunctional methylenetetrahydrofolate dehydrogenase/methenyltetrahydrofolate cyclohydrolase FolD [Bradyrhizobium sp. 180]|uniref:bifunctional methylenetetrahydrofolate dehydrogenase/methenyltetrahydrofolate cyclohydrolase FolD n=1 Tax=Bradyrhizobium sp. 180 TaxID=2782650 RepID=UPI001FF86661|nr:bifunctional methylenetetrahydrofolate dehydrogenase/methenyltetrahydrofolate cyclohydrolase FolD [Bradyrhizobium sp. 180]MCK1489113.1 bifunctional methylenetetrahydrofolate dehydrogenase/methenyltetrahydrofolate cyclohydrolase FolD [Bradyrhizobium sp. 180]
MTALIMDGKVAAARLKAMIAIKALEFRDRHKIPATLAVVLVGTDGASQVYVRAKTRACEEVGITSIQHTLGETTTEEELLDVVARLNLDSAIHGILVQLPLPRHIDPNRILGSINPTKDVDGFHEVNVGRLARGEKNGFVPCTPLGCMLLLSETREQIAGLDALVIGRSNIVGRPMAQLLLQKGATVTIAHSQTRDLAERVGRADILVAAVGVPELVKGHWIKPGAIVLDVGITRLDTGGRRIVGDVEFESAKRIAGAITPVPGGVGPMTVACLLDNTISAAFRAQCRETHGTVQHAQL